MTNGTEPQKMDPAERLDEVGMLLSLAMMRMWLRRKERAVSRDNSKVSLELAPETRLSVTAGKP